MAGGGRVTEAIGQEERKASHVVEVPVGEGHGLYGPLLAQLEGRGQ